ncbi:MAG: hypothetical protein M3126_00020 [Candidatus Eremiobacteraeota bacterium]|nr:hypothetical protein [Candidatus Eremiobacteraeota bacterium]
MSDVRNQGDLNSDNLAEDESDDLIQADADDATQSANSQALNESGTRSSSGGEEDILGADGDEIRNRTSRGENVTNKADVDNEGRVTQRSNTDI